MAKQTQTEEQTQQPQEAVMNDNRKRDQFGNPCVRVKFMNNEDPECDLEFSYQPSGGAMETWHLYPGFEYELPRYLIEHLNKQNYPIYRRRVETETGQMIHEHAGDWNRFTCHPLEW